MWVEGVCHQMQCGSLMCLLDNNGSTQEYQALDKKTCWEDQIIVGLGLFLVFIDNEKNIEFHQP